LINKPKLIAEIAKTHDGDINVASKLIEDAKTAGFDFVKFQSYDIEDIHEHPNKERYIKCHLTLKQLRELWHVANQNDIGFYCSCFSYPLIDRLREFTDIIKIPSTFFSHEVFVKKCMNVFDQVHLSSGMHPLNEVALKFSSYVDGLYRSQEKRKTNIVLYHCVSEYPTPPEHAKMGRTGGYYFRGYSDHTVGVDAMLIASTRGVDYIEKHFSNKDNAPVWCTTIEEMRDFHEGFAQLFRYFKDDGMSEEEKKNYDFYKKEFKDLDILRG